MHSDYTNIRDDLLYVEDFDDNSIIFETYVKGRQDNYLAIDQLEALLL